jgi:hypothetical protein
MEKREKFASRLRGVQSDWVMFSDFHTSQGSMAEEFLS